MDNLIPIEFKNQRILTTEQLAKVYQTTEKRISENFNYNKDRFHEGKHYFLIQGEDLKHFKNQYGNCGMVNKNASQLYLWTERGADRHCKMLGTDKAWEQFDNLEETYFLVKENAQVQFPKIDSKFLFQIAEQLQKKEKQIAIMKPKAEYFDDLVDRNLLTNFRDTAKEFKIQERQFINWLIDNHYIYRNRNKKICPYADYVDKLFELKEWKNDAKAGNQTLITPRGRETFRLLLIKDDLIKEAM